MNGIFKIGTGTKKIFLVMLSVAVTAIIIASIYYNNQNEMEDPRIIPAKKMLIRFDKLMSDQEYSKVFSLLDSIEEIFVLTPGYSDSYEMGVVYNNRGSAYLTMALYIATDSLKKMSFLDEAEKNIEKSINYYENWIDSTKDYERDEIYENLIFSFKNETFFKEKKTEKIINKKVEDILLAKIETPRRLSVSYTNLGIVKRHQWRQEDAIKCYNTALSLWKENNTAKNNLNTLLKLPTEEPSIIDQLFPKDRTKPDS